MYLQQREKLYKAFVAKVSQVLAKGVERFPNNTEIQNAQKLWNTSVNSGTSRNLLVTEIVKNLLPYEEDIKQRNENRVISDLSEDPTFSALLCDWKNLTDKEREDTWKDLSAVIQLGKALMK